MFADVVSGTQVPALEKMLAFTEARHKMLVENVANADTPGYMTKNLDPKSFQRALRRAIDDSKDPSSAGLRIKSTDQFQEDEQGHLVVTPGTEPADNVLFHDGTNGRIERQMSLLAENAMMHQAATELMRGQFDLLLKAIRGTNR